MKSFCFAYLWIVCLLISGSAREGIVIKAKSTMDAMGMGGLESDITTYMTSTARLEEKTSTGTGIMASIPMLNEMIPLKQASLTDLDKNAYYILDHDSNTYSEYNLSDLARLAERDTSMNKYYIFRTEEQEKAEEAYAADKWTVSVDSSDTVEYINGFPCKYISYTSAASDTVNNDDQTVFFYKTWWCNQVSGGEIYLEFNKRLIEQSGVGQSGIYTGIPSFFDIVAKQYQMTVEYLEARSAIPIKMVFEMRASMPNSKSELPDSAQGKALPEGDTLSGNITDQFGEQFLNLMASKSENGLKSFMTITTETTDITKTTLDDSLFQLPPDYIPE